MIHATREETALEEARAKFLKGLPDRLKAVERTIERLRFSPHERSIQDGLLRQLQALYASAQVFRLETMSSKLREATESLDAVMEAARPASSEEINNLIQVLSFLYELTGRDIENSGLLKPASQTQPRMPEMRPPATPNAETQWDEARSIDEENQKTVETEARRIHQTPTPMARPSSLGRALRGPLNTPVGIPAPPAVPAGLSTATPSGVPPVPPLSERPRKESEPPRLVPGTVVTVLVVDTPEVQAQVRAALPANNFEVKGTDALEEALRWTRSGAPDVLMVDHLMISGESKDSIRQLRSDPLTDFIPVVVMAQASAGVDGVQLRNLGVDDFVAKPFEPSKLVRTLGRVMGVIASGESTDGFIGDVTCGEIVKRVTKEFEQGLVKTLADGEKLHVPLGEGSEILAACWVAIARIRAHVTHRSGGRVKFRDTPTRKGPALFSLREEDHGTEVPELEVDLKGRQIVVVDDDPAVAWFFAGVLRTEGADVHEASQGVDVLDICRRKPIDLVISDILMPVMDGFVLCRELKRDPLLTDIPVILLSWKDDFIQRMRELHAGASGYLRKEAGSDQILRRVRQALVPVASVEKRLRTGSETRGRVEDIGVITLLRTVARIVPNARITIRDAWTLLEVHMRSGRLVDLSVTGRNGIFARGETVLPQLAGCASGRYSIIENQSEVKAVIEGTLEEALQQGTDRMGALLDAVTGTSVMNAYRVVLDQKVVNAFLATSPKPVCELINRLHAGEGPRFLLLNSDIDPKVLESALVELARRGGLREVHGPRGQDQIAKSVKTWKSRTLEEAGALEDAKGTRIEPPAGPANPPASAANAASQPTTPSATETLTLSEPFVEPAAAQSVVVPEPLVQAKSSVLKADSVIKPKLDTKPLVDTKPTADVKTGADPKHTAESSSIEAAFFDSKSAPLVAESSAALLPPPHTNGPQSDTAKKEEASFRASPKSDASSQTSSSRDDKATTRVDSTEKHITPAPSYSSARESTSVPPLHRSGGTKWGWYAVLAGLLTTGFFGWLLLKSQTSPAKPDKQAAQAETSSAKPDPQQVSTEAIPATQPDNAIFGRELDKIEEHGVTVDAGNGLVVFEPATPIEGAKIWLDERPLPDGQLAFAIPQGYHEIRIQRGVDISYRFVTVMPGHTHFLPIP